MDSNTNTNKRAFAPHISKVLNSAPGLSKREFYVRKSRRGPGIHNATEGFTVTQHELTCSVTYNLRSWTIKDDYATSKLESKHRLIITTLEQAGYTVTVDGLCDFTISK